MEKKSNYTKEFKIEALELARSLGSAAKAERQLGLSEGILYYWKRKYGFPVKSNGRSAEQAISEAEEVRRLRKENEELRKTNYILKKAAAFFSQDHLK